jgi:hypothetical protein
VHRDTVTSSAGSSEHECASPPAREPLFDQSIGDPGGPGFVVGPSRRPRQRRGGDRCDPQRVDEAPPSLPLRAGERALPPKPGRGGVWSNGPAKRSRHPRPPPPAARGERAFIAARRAGRTTPSAEIEESLVEPPISRAGCQAISERLCFAGTKWAAGDGAGQHPRDIRVDHADRLLVGEGENRPRGVRADSRQCEQRVEVIGHLPRIVLDEHAGRPVEIQRPAVVPEPCPCPHDFRGTGGGAHGRVREPTDETSEGLDHTRCLRLLEHHFTHQDPPRLPRLTPRQVSPQPGSRSENGMTDPGELPCGRGRRQTGRNRAVNSRHRRRTAGGALEAPRASRPSPCGGRSTPPRRAG